MSVDDVWVIVEGRDHDRPHYEQLLQSLRATRDLKISIRLAEETEVNGKSAGGKDHALSLHDFLAASNDLVQENKAGKSRIVFLLDQDRDAYSGTIRTSLHIIYTHGTDVEADILLNGDIWTAIRTAYGLDTRLVNKLKRAVPDPAGSLFDLWQDWLRLGLVALACESAGCAPWSQLSKVNPSHFEPANSRAVAEVEAAIRQASTSSQLDEAMARATDHLLAQGVNLLKGRWLSRYLGALVKEHLSDDVVRVNVPPNTVIDVALARLDYNGDWANGYDARFRHLLAA
jgi:hypothetical protein